jgi:hypothetical protein
MLVDTVFKRPKAELSNAVSTSDWKTHNGEWLTFKNELEPA